ncbi:MAG: hypothetical protein MZV64_61180 [Ignavibacteriales bacterium]|nr:hypothetical protein [Ignavibacteriales bacterium]
MYALIAFANLSLFAQPLMFEKVIQKNEQYYLSNTIIIKLKEKPAFNNSNELLLADKLQQTLGNFGLVLSKGMFTSGRVEKDTELEKILIVKYSSDTDPQILASKISKLKRVSSGQSPNLFIQSNLFPMILFIHHNMRSLKRQGAGGLEYFLLGDVPANIVIAIIDTGVDWDHPDLAANIWRNWDEIPSKWD